MYALGAHFFDTMQPIVTWVHAPSVEAVAAHWDGHHIVDDGKLIVFRRGRPYDSAARKSLDIFSTTMLLDDDVERQIALTVPAPEAMRWRPFARIVPAPLCSWEEDVAFAYTIVVDSSKKI
jgi:hypothetical protein